MKYAVPVSLIAVLALTATSSRATTVRGTIPVSAQIVPGTTVSAFLVNGEPVAVIDTAGTHSQSQTLPYGAPPLAVSFQMKRGEFLTQRTTWDSASRLLTIDF